MEFLEHSALCYRQPGLWCWILWLPVPHTPWCEDEDWRRLTLPAASCKVSSSLCVELFEELVPMESTCWCCGYLFKYDANPHNSTPCIWRTFYKFDFLTGFTSIWWRRLLLSRELIFFISLPGIIYDWGKVFFWLKDDYNFGCFILQSTNILFQSDSWQVAFLNSLVLGFQQRKKKALLILVACFLLEEGGKSWEKE